MNKKLFVGSLDFSTTDDDLNGLFSQHGTVLSASVIMDRDTGRSRGFGFVEYGSADEAQKAIEALDGTYLGGRNINVSEARDRQSGGGGGGGGGGGRERRGGGGGGGGGGRW
jgi:RNA recognition motif-containing protein